MPLVLLKKLIARVVFFMAGEIHFAGQTWWWGKLCATDLKTLLIGIIIIDWITGDGSIGIGR